MNRNSEQISDFINEIGHLRESADLLMLFVNNYNVTNINLTKFTIEIKDMFERIQVIKQSIQERVI